jgi:hypothetical protein
MVSLSYDESVVPKKRIRSAWYQEDEPHSTCRGIRRKEARTVVFFLLFGLGILAGMAAETAESSGSRLILLAPDNADYTTLSDPEVNRHHPSANLRLLVIREGKLLRDHGLEDTWSHRSRTERSRAKNLFEDAAIIESVEISPDRQSGVLVRLWIDAVGSDGLLSGNSAITWIDPLHAQGKWTLALPPNRFVQQAHVLDQGRGVVILTATPESIGADLTLYDQEGGTLYHLDEEAGSVLDLRISRAGAFLGVEIAYPSHDGLPDRGIVILDRLQKGNWTYTWSYGDSSEPNGWTLRDDGNLEVRSPGRSTLYDRTGQEIIPSNHRRRQSRAIRNP